MREVAGEPLYTIGGLRFWKPAEVKRRDRIEAALVACVEETLLGMNQMWFIGKVDTPLMMPRGLMSDQYDDSDVFVLKDSPHPGVPYALRAETTEGTYRLAQHMFRKGGARAPLCLYQAGQSFRRETNDGATASKLRFNAFYQLEFQCIVGESTKAPIMETLRENLLVATERLVGRDVRVVPSERLPAYSTETIDIEVMVDEPGMCEWREVASTSRRTDFPEIPGSKERMMVYEIAFGLDRMVALSA